eukprot:227593-Hanusia_phi.AAC.2
MMMIRSDFSTPFHWASRGISASERSSESPGSDSPFPKFFPSRFKFQAFRPQCTKLKVDPGTSAWHRAGAAAHWGRRALPSCQVTVVRSARPPSPGPRPALRLHTGTQDTLL